MVCVFRVPLPKTKAPKRVMDYLGNEKAAFAPLEKEKQRTGGGAEWMRPGRYAQIQDG